MGKHTGTVFTNAVKNRINEPPYKNKVFGNREFDALEFLIRGNKKGGPSKSCWVRKIVSNILNECSGLELEKQKQTASWVRVLSSEAEDGQYVVFFSVKPFKGDPMYDKKRKTTVNTYRWQYWMLAII